MTMSNLDGYITSSKPALRPVATSKQIEDRDSVFIGAIYKAISLPESQDSIRHHTNIVHASKKASHEIAAWRCMVLKHGRDGLEGPDDFEVKSGSRDDGEDYAGKKVLKVMEVEGVLDAVVIVSRWFGGTMLGPVRFTHIETCTRKVCRTFKIIEEIEACIEQLVELDEELITLRLQLPSAEADGATPQTAKTPAKSHDYAAMVLEPPNLSRAKRLVKARQTAVRSVANLLSAHKKEDAPLTGV